MDPALCQAYLNWMQATYNVASSKGFKVHWNPERQGATIWQPFKEEGRGRTLIRLGFPPSGKETALAKVTDLSVSVDGGRKQTITTGDGTHSVDFTSTLAVFYDGRLAAKVSIKTGPLARSRQALFLNRIRRLEEAKWPRKKAKRYEKKHTPSLAAGWVVIAVGLLAIAIVLTVGTLILGSVVRPIIDSLLHNIAPGFAFPMP